MTVLIYRGGKLTDKADFMLGGIEDDAAAREDFLMQYYDRAPNIPKNIYIDCQTPELDNIRRYLCEKSSHAVSISVPQRGELLKLVNMAHENAAEQLSVRVGRTEREIAALEELSGLLGLSKTPEYIECYDISNLASSDMVGGMVVMDNGRFAKKYYKKFNIKSVSEQDDYASMREVLYRRFKEYLSPDCTDEGFKRLPDLIFLDGGKGHVDAVKPLLEELKIDVPLFGLVKDDRHHTRAVISSGGEEIQIAKSRTVFSLLTKLQDEVHRYTITFQTSKRSAHIRETELTKIPGIGEKKAQALLLSFKTKQQLRSASVEDIAAVMKISLEKAAVVKSEFIDNLS